MNAEDKAGLLDEVIAPDLPDLPEPETLPEVDGWLFDSGRDYMEQLKAYKAHQSEGRPVERGLSARTHYEIDEECE